ncbi:hypothetical protein [Halosimplex amylolyticum]|uniref:hypothetical protein n=1 Tax=Halosimplex amylolyticum TaxID=3396616 RepID=UPI003F5736BB
MVDRSRWISIFSLCLGLQYAVGIVSAQNGSEDGGALGDTIVWAIKKAVKVLFRPLKGIIQNHANDAISVIIGTPHPNAVFTAPTNSTWPSIYGYFWDVMVPLALLLWALSIGIVIFLESTSFLFSGYHRSKLKRRAFSGLLGVLAWWWMDALARQFSNELAVFIAPDLSTISLFETLSLGSVGALITAITYSVDFFLLALVILIYFIREIVLYLFTLLMPVLIALWIPGVGPFSLVSKFMKRLAGFYVPFLFMTVPVAVLFRLGHLLGENFGFSTQGLGLWLTALIIPIVAIASPFVLFWQAGSIFFMAQSASRHASSRLARSRVNRTRDTGNSALHSGRNFVRGVRGQAAIRSDGQAVFDSGNSRAHAAGSRLNDTGSRLRGTFRRTTSTDARSDGGSTGKSGSSDTIETTDSQADSDDGDDRDRQFDALRDPERTGTQSSDDSKRSAIDDDPRYIR